MTFWNKVSYMVNILTFYTNRTKAIATFQKKSDFLEWERISSNSERYIV